MSDKQKSIVSLTVLKETCNDALASIAAADGVVPDDLSDLQDSDFTVIRKDFISLLAYLYSATTKTALSLKPSSPTYSASLTPLKDLSTNVSRLSSNVRLVRKEHGATVLKELQSSAQTVVSAIQNLAQTLLTVSSPEKEGEEYLAKVGEIHHAIEQIRGTGGLSNNNVAAVHKVWLADQASLVDALQELKEIAESGEDGEDFDDGWNELGVEPSPKLTEEELRRLNKVESILKLCNLLHKNVIKKVLSAPLQGLASHKDVNPIVDELASDSAALPAAVDDLVSTIYSPQDVTDMVDQLQSLSGAVLGIQSNLNALFALDLVAELFNQPLTSSGKKTPDVRKWFDTCFEEIKSLITQLSNSLQDSQ
ncbi:hypothetical protein DFP72DRAFT_335888 [Ephemerocybe angulata]|uniref:Cyclin-D1-binding protein 1 n=1 Tax=Ephemerocybe angulata TaxID=980116 RepID=A0A8H6IJ08_9AGAR|nr:hypothetical protein DFP72DRAFT_335888 [Tulosesus angulatus]